jgi:hypothetical protein
VVLYGVLGCGLGVAVVFPSFVRTCSRQEKHPCINNLRQIEGAKEQWALENKRTAGDVLTKAEEHEINDYIKGGEPKCPAGGKYTYGRVGLPPTCSIRGHTL